MSNQMLRRYLLMIYFVSFNVKIPIWSTDCHFGIKVVSLLYNLWISFLKIQLGREIIKDGRESQFLQTDENVDLR